MKALFIPLKAQYYDAFAEGRKTDESRLYGKRWNERTCYACRAVTLSRGYGKKNRISGIIAGFRVSNEVTPAFRDCYPNEKNPRVAVISIKLTPKS
jgi:ASC-1-like (ASCH) protein